MLSAECVLPKFIIGILSVQCDGISTWRFRKVLKSWGLNPLSGISAHIKEGPERSLTPLAMWEHSKKVPATTRKRALKREHDRAGTTLIWGLLSLQNYEQEISVVLATQPVEICYSSPNRWRQMISKICKISNMKKNPSLLITKEIQIQTIRLFHLLECPIQEHY